MRNRHILSGHNLSGRGASGRISATLLWATFLLASSWIGDPTAAYSQETTKEPPQKNQPAAGTAEAKASDSKPEAEKLPPATPGAQKRAAIEQALVRLKAGDAKQAEAFDVELKAIEGAIEKELDATSLEPELHIVHVGQGGLLPPGLVEGKDRFTLRFAEVKVTVKGRPVLLVLQTSNPILWKVSAAEGARIDAVMLIGDAQQRVQGVSESTWVIPPAAIAGEATDWGIAMLQLDEKGGIGSANPSREVCTRLAIGEYANDAIVVGRENPQWREQFVLARLQALAARVTKAQEEIAAKRATERLAKLKFDAIFYQDFGAKNEYGERHGSSSHAEFSLRGPREASLRPRLGKLSNVVHDKTENIKFALTEHTELVLVDEKPDARDQQKIPVDKGLLDSDRFWKMVIDPTRRRLILTTRDGRNKPLAAYDIATNKWSVLQEKFPEVSCLTYVEALDAMFAIPSGSNDRHLASTEQPKPRDTILKLDPNGKVVKTIRTSSPMDLGETGLGSTQIIYVDDLLVVLGRPASRPEPRATGMLYVVDPQTGDVLYSGRQELQREAAGAKSEVKKVADALPIRDAQGRVSIRGILAGLYRAEAEAVRLRTAGETAKAERIEIELRSLRLQLAGRKDAESSGKTELHAVGYHASNNCTVHVTDTSHPIVLALMAYQPTKWTVTTAPGVTLKRVIVSGYHRQTLASAPAGVATDISSHDDGQPYFYFTGFTDRESPRHQASLREKAGMDFSTFVGAEVYEAQSVVIGRENIAWQMQRVARRVSALTAELDVRARMAALEALETLTFTDIYPGDTTGDPRVPRGRRAGGSQIAKYTLRGPIVESVETIPSSSGEPFLDETDGVWYIWRGNGGFVRAAVGKPEEKIPFGADVPQLSWPHGLAFDTKRRRFVLNSFGGGGHLYAFDVVANKWSVLRSPGVGISALAYSSELDVLYVFNNEQGDTISTYTPEGAKIGFVKLASQVSRGEGRGQPGNPTRVKAVGKYVAVITPGAISEDGRKRKLPRIALADPRSGEVLYRGTMRPQAAPRKVTAEELEGWWKELLEADNDAADNLVWKIASGRAQTVELIVGRIGKTQPPDPAEVDKLIAQLDAEKFEDRQQAFRQLSMFGSAAESRLKNAAEHPSAEVRARVKDLLETLAKDEPASNEQRREFHAITALARVGTPDAMQALARLASRQPSDSLARRAAKAIENLGSDEEAIETKNPPPDDPRARLRRLRPDL